MDNRQTPTIRQRRDAPTALGRNRQREPVEERQEPGPVEAAASQFLLRLRALLDPGQELLGSVDHDGREVGAFEYVGYLLKIQTGAGWDWGIKGIGGMGEIE